MERDRDLLRIMEILNDKATPHFWCGCVTAGQHCQCISEFSKCILYLNVIIPAKIVNPPFLLFFFFKQVPPCALKSYYLQA